MRWLAVCAFACGARTDQARDPVVSPQAKQQLAPCTGQSLAYHYYNGGARFAADLTCAGGVPRFVLDGQTETGPFHLDREITLAQWHSVWGVVVAADWRTRTFACTGDDDASQAARLEITDGAAHKQVDCPRAGLGEPLDQITGAIMKLRFALEPEH